MSFANTYNPALKYSDQVLTCMSEGVGDLDWRVSVVNYYLILISKLGFSFIISITPFAGLDAYTPLFSFFTEGLTLALITIEAQRAFLAFIAAAMFSTFLPIGLILRSFYFTRKIGGAIIAIAIGLYVIFPLLYVMIFSGPGMAVLDAKMTGMSYYLMSVNQVVSTLVSGVVGSLSSVVDAAKDMVTAILQNPENDVGLITNNPFILTQGLLTTPMPAPNVTIQQAGVAVAAVGLPVALAAEPGVTVVAGAVVVPLAVGSAR